MKKLKGIALLMLSIMFIPVFSTGAIAAPAIELTPSIKASFDLTAAKAESPARSRLNGLFSELSVLKLQDDNREGNIRTLHYNNEQALIAVRQQIKDIDLSLVSGLEMETGKLKQRYQPLFDQYSALNSRITLAKKLKDKNLNALLRTQGDAMKIAVQFARQEIRDKQAQLRTAKETRSKKMAAARKTLAGIDSTQTAIKSQKSLVTSLNKRLSADWSDFKAAIRKQHPALTASSLSSLVSVYRQIAESKQKIIELEQKVAVVIASTKTQTGS